MSVPITRRKFVAIGAQAAALTAASHLMIVEGQAQSQKAYTKWCLRRLDRFAEQYMWDMK